MSLRKKLSKSRAHSKLAPVGEHKNDSLYWARLYDDRSNKRPSILKIDNDAV